MFFRYLNVAYLLCFCITAPKRLRLLNSNLLPQFLINFRELFKNLISIKKIKNKQDKKYDVLAKTAVWVFTFVASEGSYQLIHIYHKHTCSHLMMILQYYISVWCLGYYRLTHPACPSAVMYYVCRAGTQVNPPFSPPPSIMSTFVKIHLNSL